MTIEHENAAALLSALSGLLRAGRATAHRHANEMGAAGTSLGVLKALQAGDARPSDLAGSLHVGPSGVSRAIVPLEREGLIERRPDPRDARACRLSLTDLGRERLAAIQDAYVERVRARLADWTDDQAVTATGIIAALERSLGDGDQFASAADLTRSLIPTSPDPISTGPDAVAEPDPAYATAASTDQN
ncbi:MarR family winged helix-turn-helix transcriptional regulator [Microlunatus ginsengisoli]|uniref:HTH marR-type domain-containing protein n=1 Tax=Microlunatus ginsengisoli TaxID=363863 RepID=A0ABP7AE26_9ACTN